MPILLTDSNKVKEVIIVKIERLDEYIFENITNKERIPLIKIDVEGYVTTSNPRIFTRLA